MMKALVSKIVKRLSCRHKWNILQTIGVYSEFGYEGDIYLCACPECGKLKRLRPR